MSERERTMAELKAELDAGLQAEVETGEPVELPRVARPGERDDELLADPPTGDHHLGRFAGWRATRRLRLIVGGTLAVVVAIGVVIFVQHSREMREHRLHPLPEVEATIAPGTPREMTLADGKMRVGLSREAPAINVLHLPDRDITLARFSEKAQFKVEIRDGRTVKIEVLSGEIVETLTRDDAVPLLD